MCGVCSAHGLEKTQITAPLGKCQDPGVMMMKQKRSASEMLTKLCPRFSACSPLWITPAPRHTETEVLCSSTGQLQQHRHHRHLRGLRRTGELHRSACCFPNVPQHVRGAPAVGLSPHLPPQLRGGEVSHPPSHTASSHGCLAFIQSPPRVVMGPLGEIMVWRPQMLVNNNCMTDR